MTPWLLVPVKGLKLGKSRLAGVLDPPARLALNAFFLHRTLANARVFPGLGRTVVVTDCEHVRAIATEAGVAVVTQSPQSGLNGAAHEGLGVLRQAGAQHVIVLMNDLPTVRPDDLLGLADRMQRHAVVLCPDKCGTGTNALAMPASATMRMRFGGASLVRHHREAIRAGLAACVHHNRHIALDIDTGPDLLQWLGSGEMDVLQRRIGADWANAESRDSSPSQDRFRIECHGRVPLPGLFPG
jgi:2-phospho-L-lactate guanylyltransferase